MPANTLLGLSQMQLNSKAGPSNIYIYIYIYTHLYVLSLWLHLGWKLENTGLWSKASGRIGNLRPGWKEIAFKIGLQTGLPYSVPRGRGAQGVIPAGVPLRPVKKTSPNWYLELCGFFAYVLPKWDENWLKSVSCACSGLSWRQLFPKKLKYQIRTLFTMF